MRPVRSKRMARELVVPWSRERIISDVERTGNEELDGTIIRAAPITSPHAAMGIVGGELTVDGGEPANRAHIRVIVSLQTGRRVVVDHGGEDGERPVAVRDDLDQPSLHRPVDEGGGGDLP